jgi:hypothetical protein
MEKLVALGIQKLRLRNGGILINWFKYLEVRQNNFTFSSVMIILLKSKKLADV